MAAHETNRSLLDARTVEAGLVREFLKQSRAVTRKISDVGHWPVGRRILEESCEVRSRVVVFLARLLAAGNQRRSSQTYRVKRVGDARFSEWNPQGIIQTVGWTYRQGLMMKGLMSRLMRSRLPFDEEQLVCLVNQLCMEEAWYWKVPASPIMTAVERHVRERGLPQALRRAVEELQKAGEENDLIVIPKAIRSRLVRILQNHEG